MVLSFSGHWAILCRHFMFNNYELFSRSCFLWHSYYLIIFFIGLLQIIYTVGRRGGGIMKGFRCLRGLKSNNGFFIRNVIEIPLHDVMIMVIIFLIWFAKDSPYGLLRWWRSLITAGTLELLPKRPKAKRSLLQYVLGKECRKVMRSVLCCSYCGWIQSHERYGRLRHTGYLSLHQLRSLTF